MYRPHEHQPDSSPGGSETSPRVLLINDDPDIIRAMLAGIKRACCDDVSPEELAQGFGSYTCRCAEPMGSDMRPPEIGHPLSTAGTATSRAAGQEPCVMVLRTLREFHNHDLSTCDIVICGSVLPDGSGLDVLAYVRGIRPNLPVMISGDPCDTPLAVEAIRAGAADFLVTAGGDLRMLPLTIEKCLALHRIKQENEQLQNDLGRSLSETAVKNRQLQALINQLETMARTDDLTGLCNRRWLNLMLERAWAESLRHGHPLAFMMIDLDGFKVINDVLGHQQGDELLRITGRVLDANCRQVDFPARYGGDEFCILLPNTLPNEAVVVMQRVQRAFLDALEQFLDCATRRSSERQKTEDAAEHSEFSFQQSHGDEGLSDAEHWKRHSMLDMGMSIGLSHIHLSRPKSFDQLITHADEALYAAKRSGRNALMIRELNGISPLREVEMPERH